MKPAKREGAYPTRSAVHAPVFVELRLVNGQTILLRRAEMNVNSIYCLNSASEIRAKQGKIWLKLRKRRRSRQAGLPLSGRQNWAVDAARFGTLFYGRTLRPSFDCVHERIAAHRSPVRAGEFECIRFRPPLIVGEKRLL
jgi:hypothetical protein